MVSACAAAIAAVWLRRDSILWKRELCCSPAKRALVASTSSCSRVASSISAFVCSATSLTRVKRA
jgi:hypothetical protein